MPKSTKSTISSDDQQVLDKLAEAEALYSRYLELTRIASIPQQIAKAAAVPHRPEAPLSLVITK